MIYCLTGKIVKKSMSAVVLSCGGVGYYAQCPASVAGALPGVGKEATLYTAFRRLEENGYISSYWGDESTGARRRYYTITNEGRQALERLKAEWQTAKALIDALITDEEETDHAG